MQVIVAIVALAIAVENTSADLDRIQDATPIGIPLNNPSIELGGVNNGDAALEEHDLSGYRPLYPPYFQRKGNEQQKQTYYDKDYYSRGAHIGNFDARLDRTLKTPAAAGAASAGPSDGVQVYMVSLDSRSRPDSVLQLQNQPTQLQLPFPVQTQFQPRPRIQSLSQQYARGFSNYRTQHTQSYFYTFKFPTS